MSITLEIS